MTTKTKYRNFDIFLDCDNSKKKKFILKYCNTKGKLATFCTNFDDNATEYVARLNNQVDLEFESEEWQREAGRVLVNTFFPIDQPIGKIFRHYLCCKYMRLRLIYTGKNDTKGELLSIPWEYLYIDKIDNPDIKIYGYLCRNERFSLAHCLQKVVDKRSWKIDQLPVKVAFLSTENVPNEQFQDVRKNVSQKKRHKRLIRLDNWQKLTEVSDFHLGIEEYHIVQSLSHGSRHAFTDADGKEIDDNKLKELVDGKIIQARVIVLCACDGAIAPQGPAATLHKAGVPVIVGMTQAIDKKKAVTFMENFYSGLARTVFNLEEVLSDVRSSMVSFKDILFTPHQSMPSLDWGLPRLFLTNRTGSLILDNQLFRPIYDLLPQFKEEIARKLKKAGDDAIFTMLEKLEEWVKGPQKILYLQGKARSGKSTEIANFLDKNAQNKQLIYHFCAELEQPRIEENSNHMLTFVRDSLYHQLENLYGQNGQPVYRDWLNNGIYPVLLDDAADALEQLVISPLRRARDAGHQRRPILVIDGIDHAYESRPGDSILQLLIDNKDTLTEVLRLIVTADSNNRKVDRMIRQQLKPDHVPDTDIVLNIESDPDTVLDLTAFSPTDRSQVKDTLDILGYSGQEDFIHPQRLSFLQMDQFVKRINPETSKISYESVADQFRQQAKQKRGQTITDMYRAYLETLQQSEAIQPQMMNLLKALSVGYAPIPKDMAAEMLGTNVEKIESLANTGIGFIKITKEGLQCENSGVKRFLKYTFAQADQDKGHDLFVSLYRSLINDREWDDITVNDWFKMKYIHYGQYYLAYHAYERYRVADQPRRSQWANDFLDLMVSSGFRTFRYTSEGYEEAIEDVRRALKVEFSEGTLPQNAWSSQFPYTLDKMMTAYSNDNTLAIVALEKRLRRENNGRLALKEFLGLIFPIEALN